MSPIYDNVTELNLHKLFDLTICCGAIGVKVNHHRSNDLKVQVPSSFQIICDVLEPDITRITTLDTAEKCIPDWKTFMWVFYSRSVSSVHENEEMFAVKKRKS